MFVFAQSCGLIRQGGSSDATDPRSWMRLVPEALCEAPNCRVEHIEHLLTVEEDEP